MNAPDVRGPAAATEREAIYRIFDEALARPLVEREQFVSARCAGNAARLAEVHTLLAFADRDAPAWDPQSDEARRPTYDPLLGTQLGHFRLCDRLGSGGMGVVYRAERTDGLAQAVAIKLLSGEITPSGLARLEREAQLLARLEHPAIARFIDFGVQDGRAWIAQEFVHGLTIEQYCDQHRLSRVQRVRLLALLADAVAAAHRGLVVHQDLQPGNVLVNDEGRPKIIDFGIAATLTPGGEASRLERGSSEAGAWFTPNYAAPELIRGEPGTVATDVFGLGALGYRLLTGVVPYPEAPGPIRYVLAIGEREVAPPSRAAQNAGMPERQVAALRGDLDAILRKALARDPRQRYPTAAAMRDDLWRYVDIEPVRARRPTIAYRLGKFVRRNALVVGVGVLGLIAVGAGTIAYLRQLEHVALARALARSNAEQARAVTAFLAEDIIGPASTQPNGVGPAGAMAVLDHATLDLDRRFAGRPLVRAELQRAIGKGYVALLAGDKAEPLLREAERGLARELGEAHRDTQEARRYLMVMYAGQFDTDTLPQALAEAQRMEQAEQAAHVPNPDIDIAARMMLAAIPCFQAARAPYLSDCAPRIAPVLAEAEKRLGPIDPTTTGVRYFHAMALFLSDRMGEALATLPQACAALEHDYGDRHPWTNYCRSFWSVALESNGHADEALQLAETSIARIEALLGPTSPETIDAHHDLARMLWHAGRSGAALVLAEQCFVQRQRQLGPDNAATRSSGLLLADIQAASGQIGAALRYLEPLYERLNTQSPGEPMTLAVRAQLARTLAGGQASRAEALLRLNLQAALSGYAGDDWMIGERELDLGETLSANTDALRRESVRLLQDALRRLTPRLGTDHLDVRRIRRALAARQPA